MHWCGGPWRSGYTLNFCAFFLVHITVTCKISLFSLQNATAKYVQHDANMVF